MQVKGFDVGLRSGAGPFEVGLDLFDRRTVDPLQHIGGHTLPGKDLPEPHPRVAFKREVPLLLVTVELPSHAAGVMSQQWHVGLDDPGARSFTDASNDLPHPVVGFREVATVETDSVHPGETRRKLVCVHRPGFLRRHADTPAVVLHEEHDGESLQDRVLKGFRDLSFRETGVTERADGDRRGTRGVFREVFRVPVTVAELQTLRDTRRRDRLHARGAALVDDGRVSVAAVVGMRVVLPSAGEHVVALRQQLQHQRERGEAEAQKDALVAVVGTHEILRQQMIGCRQLHGFVAP